MEQITEISIKEISLSGFRNQKEPVSFALGDVNCVTGHNGTGGTDMYPQTGQPVLGDTMMEAGFR